MTNIAIVVLDTLRKDSFDEMFGWLPGCQYENAYSTGSWTVPSHASLFAGKYPSELGVHSKNRYLDCKEETLAEVLCESGYYTASYSCNPYVSNIFDFDRGFDEFKGSWRLKHFDPELFDWKEFLSKARDQGSKRYLKALWGCVTGDCKTIPSLRHGMRLKLRGAGLSAGRAKDDGAQSALKYIKKRSFGTDEFLFINLMEAHAPYTPPPEYRSVELDERPGLIETVSGKEFENPSKVKKAYDDCVRYLSDIYQKIFSELSTDFEYIITLGDHGEMFGEDGVWAHSHGVYPELVHIPLSIYGEEFEGSTEGAVSLLDVHQTVLEIADIESDSHGKSLLSDSHSVDRLTEYMGLTRDDISKLSEKDIPEDKIKKYDSEFRGVLTEDGSYAYETVDGFQCNKSNRSYLKRLSNLTDKLQRRELSNENELPPEVLDQLEDLGYA
jgi:arylsulfatase A-like enzyme